MGENQHGPSCRPGGWAPTLPHAYLDRAGSRHVQDRPPGPRVGPLTQGSTPAPGFPGKHLPDHGPQATTLPTDQAQCLGPQPPSPRQPCHGLAYLPKPAGGCWRGFYGPSLGSGWPWPHPPTAHGCGARWGHTDGTHSSCGCPPATTRDRDHRRYEESGWPGAILCPPREVTALPRASPVASSAGFGLDVLGHGSCPGQSSAWGISKK